MPATIRDHRPIALNADYIEGLREDQFLLKFDSDGCEDWFVERHIIGGGFQPISNALLLPGQPVYCTHQNREVAGVVLNLPDIETSTRECAGPASSNSSASTVTEMWHNIKLNETGETIRRRKDDLRLLASRKSRRIKDNKITDYARLLEPDLGEVGSNAPATAMDESQKIFRGQKRALDRTSYNTHRSKPEVTMFFDPNGEKNQEIEAMNIEEVNAALVLMSLGGSPRSPAGAKLPQKLVHQYTAGLIKLQKSSAAAALTAAGLNSTPSSIVSSSWPSHRTTPSPPGSNNTNASSQDEGIDLSTASVGASPILITCYDYEEDDNNEIAQPPRKRVNSTTIGYKCTWPTCSHQERTKRAIHNHIVQVHEQQEDDVEFYYITVEKTSSVSAEKKGFSPSRTKEQLQRGKPVLSPLNQSPVTVVARRGREVKKCRKVYGMENRELWCTQCKWKKACTRFNNE